MEGNVKEWFLNKTVARDYNLVIVNDDRTHLWDALLIVE